MPTTRVMAVIKNNIEIWTLEQSHLQKIKEYEQTKQITQALMDKGISKADVATYYEDLDMGLFDY